MAAAKIEGALLSALRKLASKPTVLLDVVVTPAQNSAALDLEALRRYVEGHGGEIVRASADRAQVRLPVAEIPALASSGLAPEVRMARVARMH